MAKSCRAPTEWSSIIQAVDTEDQCRSLAFFSIWPFDGTWLISLVLPFGKMDDEQKELQSGVSVAFEKLTFKAVRLPRARQLWLQRIATAFYSEQMHTCLHLIEIRVCLPSVHAGDTKFELKMNLWAILIGFQILAKDPELFSIVHYFHHIEMKGSWIVTVFYEGHWFTSSKYIENVHWLLSFHGFCWQRKTLQPYPFKLTVFYLFTVLQNFPILVYVCPKQQYYCTTSWAIGWCNCEAINSVNHIFCHTWYFIQTFSVCNGETLGQTYRIIGPPGTGDSVPGSKWLTPFLQVQGALGLGISPTIHQHCARCCVM